MEYNRCDKIRDLPMRRQVQTSAPLIGASLRAAFYARSLSFPAESSLTTLALTLEHPAAATRGRTSAQASSVYAVSGRSRAGTAKYRPVRGLVTSS